MEKRRLNFRCWNCDQEYTKICTIDGRPRLTVACPFCEEEGVADLNPYRSDATPVYKGLEEGTAPPLPAYDFPPVIPSVPPPAEQES